MAYTGRPEIPILANPATLWDCPNCTQTAMTNVASPHTRFHDCPGLGGLSAPFVQQATNRGPVEVKPVVREDYVGGERGLTYDADGKPIMAIVTRYDDGSNDAAVFAPVARRDGRQ